MIFEELRVFSSRGRYNGKHCFEIQGCRLCLGVVILHMVRRLLVLNPLHFLFDQRVFQLEDGDRRIFSYLHRDVGDLVVSFSHMLNKDDATYHEWKYLHIQ